MLNIRPLSIIVCATMLLFACKKESSLSSNGNRLKGVNWNEDSAFFSNYLYDQQGRLSQAFDSSRNGVIFKYNYHYNQEGQLDLIDEFNNGDGMGVQPVFLDSLAYNNIGQAVKLYQKSAIPAIDNIYKAIRSFSYDNNNRLVTDSSYNWYETASYRKFSYNNEDDITGIQFFDNQGNEIIDYHVEANYDKKTNPFYAFAFIHYLNYNRPLLLSKHNTRQVMYRDHSIENYKYVYFSNGLPQKAETLLNMWDEYSSIEFKYE